MALNRKLTASALAIGLAFGLSAAALSAEGALRHADEMRNLTRAEAQANAEKLFDRLDANHDGKLDVADRTARIEARRDALFDRLDTNHDGMISRAEFRAAPRPGMAGGWHHREGDTAPAGGAAANAPQRGWQGGGQWRERREGGHRGMMLVGIILHRADPNHTGTVTRDAFVGAALALFDEADTNHDGVVTGEERAAERGRLRYRLREARHAQAGREQHATTKPAAPPAP